MTFLASLPDKHTQPLTIGHDNRITYTLAVLDQAASIEQAFRKSGPELLSRRPLWFSLFPAKRREQNVGLGDLRAANN